MVSYTTISPLRGSFEPLRGMFLWPDPAGKWTGIRQYRPPPRVLPGTLLCGVRTFLDSGILSRDRPTNLGLNNTILGCGCPVSLLILTDI